MLRYRRGEHLAAMRMVQVYALDRVVEWIDRHEAPTAGVRRDPFNADPFVGLRPVTPSFELLPGNAWPTWPVGRRAFKARLKPPDVSLLDQLELIGSYRPHSLR